MPFSSLNHSLGTLSIKPWYVACKSYFRKELTKKGKKWKIILQGRGRGIFFHSMTRGGEKSGGTGILLLDLFERPDLELRITEEM